MKQSIANRLDLITPNYPAKQLNHSLKLTSKIKLFKRKLLRGYDISMFQKKGNGLKTIMEKTGRLNDLSGLYVISSSTGEPLILSSSKKVLADIQQLARGKRAKDKMILEKVAIHYGFHSYKMGRELLLAMKVNWLEVTDKTFRLMLRRAMSAEVKFML
ncbi:MAG: hypothetical protein ABJH98_11420 [Reichenbachiella sp.]|uniref:hypothetical protein n=1 Tax=Reichenbachiella sp. TaxID=2184521 RepID=UPI003298E395